VPTGAGVGSAIGFLRAPVGYEVVRSLYQRFSTFDVEAVNALLADMVREAEAVVAEGSFGAATRQVRTAFMRYVGQGHEIPVSLPARVLVEADVASIRADYDRAYAHFYDRPVPGSDVEIMSYAVQVSTVMADVAARPASGGAGGVAQPARWQAVRDTVTGEVLDWAVYDRSDLVQGLVVPGRSIIAENETSTMVGPNWIAWIDASGNIEMVRAGENA
jgi:N-methylhydantoinase A